MKKRKYLYRLSMVMLGLIIPALLFFLIFWKSAFGQMEQTNEDFYEKALVTYTSLLNKKIRDLEMFAAEISADSLEHDSALLGGAGALGENTYQLYAAVNELREKYSRNDVSEWGIYLYDIDRLITPEYTYTLDHFIYKYTNQSIEEAECSGFFSEENYSLLRIFFDTTNEEEESSGYLLAGVCTRIGNSRDRALVFYVLSPKDINDSLAIVGGEGIAYYLLDAESESVLLAWGDVPEEKAGNILDSDGWERTPGGKQKVLYNIGSIYPQLSVTAHISQDSMQNNLMDWAVYIRRLLLCTVVFLLLICILALYISYKPVYELVSEFDDLEDGEFEQIRNMLEGKDLRIGEQEMMILDLLVNHLIYGVPISEERIKRLGIGESVHYYCVFLVEGYFFRNSEVETLTGEAEENHNARIFITDWQEENYSVVIAFLKEENASGLQEELERWLKENYAEEYSLYIGRIVDKLENIQLSFRSCLSQMKKKNEKKQKADTEIPTPDQLTWRALPAYGNTFVKTPNIDRIAGGGLLIDGCYTARPLCQPARAALWTGRYPHETGVLSNGRKWPEKGIPKSMPTLGETFAGAGWQCVHFGKTHDAGALRGFFCEPEEEIAFPEEDSAFVLNEDSFRDRYTAEAACRFLRERKDTRPLLMITDLVNPHNICGWVGANQGVHESIPCDLPLPPLPENFEFEDMGSRPVAVRYICCTNNRQSQTAGWTAENFREYLRAYYYYLSLADRELGIVLDEMEEQGYTEENTLFILTADHGDGMAGRGQVTKQVSFYEETTRVPMIFKGKGIRPGKKEGIASLLDLFPTLCGQAGIAPPEGLRGRDLSCALSGGAMPEREYVAGEWHTEWGYTVSPGRMIRTERYKYTRYIEDGGEELFDLKEDPFERKNLAGDPDSAVILAQMRKLYKKHLELTEDPFESLSWKADHRWRSHPMGYWNHKGIAAPMEEDV